MPWDEAQKDGLPARAVRRAGRWYREHYTRRELRRRPVDGEPAGRLYVHRGESEIRIVDIALLPEHRGDGVGSALLRDLLAEADADGKRVTIHVERLNPALRLYERLGFAVAEDRASTCSSSGRPPT